MNLERAIQFVKSQGNDVEQARLSYILASEAPAPEVIASLFADQRADGGWSAFCAQGYSSLDATCFQLAQAEQFGIGNTERAVQRAVRLLSKRQSLGGRGPCGRVYATLGEARRSGCIAVSDRQVRPVAGAY